MYSAVPCSPPDVHRMARCRIRKFQATFRVPEVLHLRVLRVVPARKTRSSSASHFQVLASPGYGGVMSSSLSLSGSSLLVSETWVFASTQSIVCCKPRAALSYKSDKTNILTSNSTKTYAGFSCIKAAKSTASYQTELKHTQFFLSQLQYFIHSQSCRSQLS